MKPHLSTIVLVVAAALLFAASSSQAQTNLTNGSWNSTISPAAGGTKTAISFFATGDWVTNGWISTVNSPGSSGFGIGFSGLFGSPSGAWSFATTSYFAGNYCYYTNHTKGTSVVLDTIAFDNPGAFQALAVTATNTISFDSGDHLQFFFDTTPVAVEIDLAFNNFNSGTYNGVDNNGTQFNLEVVPEPSTYALLALSAAGLGGYVLRRRRK